jgi:hypothetical protein
MTEYRYGKRLVGWSATKTRVVTMADGHRSVVVDETEPIYIDCDGTRDLGNGSCLHDTATYPRGGDDG